MEHQIHLEPIKKYHYTKIIATIGPATHSYEAVLRMVQAGVDGIRVAEAVAQAMLAKA